MLMTLLLPLNRCFMSDAINLVPLKAQSIIEIRQNRNRVLLSAKILNQRQITALFYIEH